MSEQQERRLRARRIPVILTIALLAVLAGVANATVKAHHAASISAPALSPSEINEHSSATSSAWYCAGPLPLKSSAQSSSIVVTNLSSRSVEAQVNVSQSTGVRLLAGLSLSADSTETYVLAHSKSAGFAAATVLVDSADVAVVEVMNGTQGNVSAPCVTTDTNQDYVVGSSTKGANNVALALFDPGATPAVANVSLLTDSGLVNPPAFQGIPLEAGGLAVLSVGRYAPDHALVSAVVTSNGGRIVAGALETQTFSKSEISDLIPGSPATSSDWFFSAAPAGPGSHQQFVVANPSTASLTVHVELGGAQGEVSEPLVVPGGSSELAIPVPSTVSEMSWAELSSRPNSSFVVTRETTVQKSVMPRVSPPVTSQVKGAAKTAPKTGAKTKAKPAATTGAKTAPAGATGVMQVPSQASLLSGVALGVGSSVSSPVLRPGRSWLVVGQSDPIEGEVMTIANLSDSPSVVNLEQLGAPTALAAYGLDGLILQAHGEIEVNLGEIYKHAPVLATVVHATGNVLVGSLLYARGSSGSIGLAAPSAMPLD